MKCEGNIDYFKADWYEREFFNKDYKNIKDVIEKGVLDIDAVDILFTFFDVAMVDVLNVENSLPAGDKKAKAMRRKMEKLIKAVVDEIDSRLLIYYIEWMKKHGTQKSEEEIIKICEKNLKS